MNDRVKRFNQSTHFAKITVEAKEDGPTLVRLVIDIHENNFPVIQDITITGNKEISERFILNFLGLKSGQNYNLAEFQHRISLLYGLDYFSDIKYFPSPTKVEEILSYI